MRLFFIIFFLKLYSIMRYSVNIAKYAICLLKVGCLGETRKVYNVVDFLTVATMNFFT